MATSYFKLMFLLKFLFSIFTYWNNDIFWWEYEIKHGFYQPAKPNYLIRFLGLNTSTW